MDSEHRQHGDGYLLFTLSASNVYLVSGFETLTPFSKALDFQQISCFWITISVWHRDCLEPWAVHLGTRKDVTVHHVQPHRAIGKEVVMTQLTMEQVLALLSTRAPSVLWAAFLIVVLIVVAWWLPED